MSLHSRAYYSNKEDREKRRERKKRGEHLNRQGKQLIRQLEEQLKKQEEDMRIDFKANEYTREGVMSHEPAETFNRLFITIDFKVRRKFIFQVLNASVYKTFMIPTDANINLIKTLLHKDYSKIISVDDVLSVLDYIANNTDIRNSRFKNTANFFNKIREFMIVKQACDEIIEQTGNRIYL